MSSGEYLAAKALEQSLDHSLPEVQIHEGCLTHSGKFQSSSEDLIVAVPNEFVLLPEGNSVQILFPEGS